MEQIQKYTIAEFTALMKKVVPALKSIVITKTHVILTEDINANVVGQQVVKNRSLPTDDPNVH